MGREPLVLSKNDRDLGITAFANLILSEFSSNLGALLLSYIHCETQIISFTVVPQHLEGGLGNSRHSQQESQSQNRILLWAELCSPKIRMLKFQALVPQKVIIFGDKFFEVVIKLKCGQCWVGR